MKKIFFYTLLFIPSQVFSQDLNFSAFFSDIESIVISDTVLIIDLENLLQYQEEVISIYETNDLDQSEKNLLNYFQILLEKLSERNSNYDEFLENISSSEYYTIYLLARIGKEQEYDFSFNKYRFFNGSFTFGQGFNYNKEDHSFKNTSIYGIKLYTELYIFDKIRSSNPSKKYISYGASYYWVLEDQELNLYAGLDIGYGTYFKNLNGLIISGEYLLNIQNFSNDRAGISLLFSSEHLSVSSKLQFDKESIINLYTIQFDIFKYLGIFQ